MTLELARQQLTRLKAERKQAESEIEAGKAKLIVFDAQIAALEKVIADTMPAESAHGKN
jgi:hypothetical protein